jgi:hypothetical protein
MTAVGDDGENGRERADEEWRRRQRAATCPVGDGF